MNNKISTVSGEPIPTPLTQIEARSVDVSWHIVSFQWWRAFDETHQRIGRADHSPDRGVVANAMSSRCRRTRQPVAMYPSCSKPYRCTSGYFVADPEERLAAAVRNAIIGDMSRERKQKDWAPLGFAIRERRLSKLLTLVDLANKAGLSQPFLSQVENGRARPSLMSLHRIADALETTPQAFFGGPVDETMTPTVVRANEVQVVEVDATCSQSTCHVLLGGDAPFHMLEFNGLPSEFLEYFEHDGFEAAYVIRGRVEIDIAGDVSALTAGDTISYPARLPHRLRAIGKNPVRVLLVETKVATLQRPGTPCAWENRPERSVSASSTGRTQM